MQVFLISKQMNHTFIISLFYLFISLIDWLCRCWEGCLDQQGKISASNVDLHLLYAGKSHTFVYLWVLYIVLCSLLLHVYKCACLLQILQQAWPFFGMYMEKLLIENIQPSVRTSSPHLKTFAFTKVHMGQKVWFRNLRLIPPNCNRLY